MKKRTYFAFALALLVLTAAPALQQTKITGGQIVGTITTPQITSVLVVPQNADGSYTVPPSISPVRIGRNGLYPQVFGIDYTQPSNTTIMPVADPATGAKWPTSDTVVAVYDHY